MSEPVWGSQLEAWTVPLANELLKECEVSIQTFDPDVKPTTKQMAAIESLESFTADTKKAIAAALEKWAEDEIDQDELDDLEDGELQEDLTVTSVSIPPLRDTKNLYALLRIDTCLDIEHGVVIACRNGSEFAVMEADFEDPTEWDDVDELESRFRE